MADFPTSKIPNQNAPNGTTTVVGPTGTVATSKRMLGDDGAAAIGNGAWIRVDGLWKTFFLYNQDRVGAVDAGVDVRIEAAMELAEDPNDPDADTFVHELAALTAGSSLTFSTEHPWRFVRARVAAHAGAKAVQVGFQVQGL